MIPPEVPLQAAFWSPFSASEILWFRDCDFLSSATGGDGIVAPPEAVAGKESDATGSGGDDSYTIGMGRHGYPGPRSMPSHTGRSIDNGDFD